MSIARTAATAFGLTAAAGLAVLAVAGPAAAAGSTSNYYVAVDQCPTVEQVCRTVPTVTIDTTSGVVVEFTANRNHCSDIIAHIIVDGAEWGSAQVGPGHRDGSYYIPLTPGLHDIGVQAEGVTGGCNTGYLSAWGGNLRVETD